MNHDDLNCYDCGATDAIHESPTVPGAMLCDGCLQARKAKDDPVYLAECIADDFEGACLLNVVPLRADSDYIERLHRALETHDLVLCEMTDGWWVGVDYLDIACARPVKQVAI